MSNVLVVVQYLQCRWLSHVCDGCVMYFCFDFASALASWRIINFIFWSNIHEVTLSRSSFLVTRRKNQGAKVMLASSDSTRSKESNKMGLQSQQHKGLIEELKQSATKVRATKAGRAQQPGGPPSLVMQKALLGIHPVSLFAAICAMSGFNYSGFLFN